MRSNEIKISKIESLSSLQYINSRRCVSLSLRRGITFRWIISAPEKLIPSAVLKFRIFEHEKKVGLKLPHMHLAYLASTRLYTSFVFYVRLVASSLS